MENCMKLFFCDSKNMKSISEKLQKIIRNQRIEENKYWYVSKISRKNNMLNIYLKEERRLVKIKKKKLWFTKTKLVIPNNYSIIKCISKMELINLKEELEYERKRIESKYGKIYYLKLVYPIIQSKNNETLMILHARIKK